MAVRNILIVDDESKVAFLLGKALERCDNDYQVSIAHSGEEALRLLGKSPVDVLVTDMRMPGVSGLELIRWVRSASPDTRTILMTAYDNPQVEAEAHDLGAHCYITKPFSIDLFTQKVQDALFLSREETALVDEHHRRDLVTALISHKLRMPLTYIVNYADAMLERARDAQEREWLENILRHSLQMREVIDDLTLLGEWSVGQLPGYRQQVDLAYMLRVTVAQLSSLAVRNDQIVTVTIPPEPLQLSTDRWLLGVLLTALVASALKHAPSGGRVNVTAQRNDAGINVSVTRSDGILPAASRMGVNLDIVSNLARALNGSLHIVEKADDDVVLRLLLPLTIDLPQTGSCNEKEVAGI